MPSYDNTLQDIKDRIDIVDLISEYINLKKTGRNWKGLCPFHTEKTPSFTVSPAKQIFHCFGCGTGGDIFTFMVRHETLTFPEALNMLAKRAGVTLKIDKHKAVKTGEKETLLNIHREALDFFQQNLPKNAEAQSYLNKRGISRDIQKMFSIGYAPKSWNALLNHLMRKKYNPEIVKKAGLAVHGNKGHYDTFRNRIIFPIFDLKGDAVAFGGRSIDGSEPKYLNSPETPIFNKGKVLYGLNRAKDPIRHDGYAIFMEGYTDVISAHIHGFSTAIASLGTAFTPDHGRLIKRFTENIVLVFDNDQAGIKAAKNAANILFESGLNVKILSFPENDDPDSFLKKHGKDAFSKLIEHPLTIIDFMMKQGGDKHAVAREAIETIARIPSRVLQGEYVRTLSEKLKVNELFVLEELKRIKGRPRSGYKQPASQASAGPKKRPRLEMYIIKLLFQLPGDLEEITGKLSVDDFKDETLRGIFKKMKEKLTDFNELISTCEGEEKNLMTRISLMEDFENPQKVLSDCVKRLQDNKRMILLQNLQAKIREAEQKKDLDLCKQLQMEQQKLLKP